MTKGSLGEQILHLLCMQAFSPKIKFFWQQNPETRIQSH